MSKKVLPPRGMNDILPVDAQRRQEIIQTLIPVYAKWGFVPVDCPAMENIDRLIGSDGGDNEKLVFQVLRRGLDKSDYEAAIFEPLKMVDMGLRFDLTVPLARFYASNYNDLPKVSKFLQYGTVWRAERPQKGRFRQFMQWDADIVGDFEGLPEIEIILCTSEALLALGLSNFVVRFNDRRVLKALVDSVGIEPTRHSEAFVVIDKLDKIGIDGIKKEMEERGFNLASITKLIQKIAPFLVSKAESIESGLHQLQINLDDKTAETMKEVFDEVSRYTSNYSIVFDPTLVRGMGYYTGQIFEIEYGDYPFSIAGGGRYDGMIGRFLGRDIPACGFSLGFDRILTILNDKNIWPSNGERKKLVLLIEKESVSNALKHSYELRSQGWDVSIVLKVKNIKKQLEEYRAIGFSHFCILGNFDAIEIRSIE
jgi:histidyl-tRNA synthetase